MASIKVYWDSDCFLGWFLNEPDKVPKCKGTVQGAQNGNVQIITSAITLTEVIKLKNRPKLKKANEKMIADFFKNDFIIIRNLDRKVGAYARELIWRYSKLKPKDSIHLATAILCKIPELNTFDKELLSLDGKITRASIKICMPNIPYQEEMKFSEDEE